MSLEETLDAEAMAGTSQPVDVGSELALARDKFLRAQAELDNYRKRARRELEDERKYALMPLLRDLLPVVDNIQRAIDAAEKSSESGSLLEGFKLVSQQLAVALAKHHCVPIAALGEPFDPHRHDAILEQPSPDHPPGTVIMVTQPGYILHDRVVRPAQVIVAKAP